MSNNQNTEYLARARATLGAELGALADQLAPRQIEALATEVVTEVLANDRGFGEYVATYVANITASSVTDADRLRKLRGYADILSGDEIDPDRQAWNEGASMECPECGVFTREGDDCPSGHYAQQSEPSESHRLEACVDCLMLIANGEAPEDRPELSDDIEAEWPSDEWHLAVACSEECAGGFSWSRCDTCGSDLGGDRHPVVAFKVETKPTEPESERDPWTELLDSVRTDVIDRVAYELTDGTDVDDIEWTDIAFEAADSGVPVYTSDLARLCAERPSLLTDEPEIGPAQEHWGPALRWVVANIFEALEAHAFEVIEELKDRQANAGQGVAA